ncbi:mutator family transposase/transposase [Methylorubrum extorquens]
MTAETYWTALLCKMARRDLRGVKLVITDTHEGIMVSAANVMNATWQRRRVHFMRNLLARAGRSGRRIVRAFIATAFVQDDAEAARPHWLRVADQLRPKGPMLAALVDEAESDVLARRGAQKQMARRPRSRSPSRCLARRLDSLPVALVLLEATGGFEASVAAALATLGLPLCIVNPRQIRDFARAMGRLAKTDTLDAEVIALFAERIRPPPGGSTYAGFRPPGSRP